MISICEFRARLSYKKSVTNQYQNQTILIILGGTRYDNFDYDKEEDWELSTEKMKVMCENVHRVDIIQTVSFWQFFEKIYL